jgi:hypothetical protein
MQRCDSLRGESASLASSGLVHAVLTCSFLKWLIGNSPRNVVWIVTGSAMATFWRNLVETHTHGMPNTPVDSILFWDCLLKSLFLSTVVL